MTRLILTRHGETDWNARHKIQGSTDIPLNETGRAQARLLARRLANVEIQAIYSSDYQRALDTARAVHAHHPDAQLEILEDLRERSWGELEGHTWKDIERDHPEAVRGITSGDLDFTPPGGESKKFVLNRIMRALGRIVRVHPDQRVLAVTHGGVVSLILKHALNVDVAAPTPFRVENCALHILDTEDGGHWYIHSLNDMSHLELDVP